MPRKYLIVLFFLALSLLSDASFAQLQDDGQPCPPECVTDSMEIVTWYPSPYNEYEELRLYPKHSAEESQCNSFEQLGLMYYNQDEYTLKICRQDPDTLNYIWEKIPVGQEGYWDLSGRNIYNTNSGSVGIGTINPNPTMKLHVYDSEKAEIRLQSGGANSYARLAFQTDDGDLWRAGMDSSGNFTFTGFSGTWGDRMTITTSGNVGIGTTLPQSVLDVNGGIRTKQGYGAIQQTSNSVPFSGSYVNSHDGETHIWVASAPDLKDGSYCGSGPNAGYRFFDRFSVKGQYIVTLQNDGGTAKIHGQWAGGNVGMKDPGGADVTNGTGSVNFTIFWDGSSWRLDNMVGSVGSESISCF